MIWVIEQAQNKDDKLFYIIVFRKNLSELRIFRVLWLFSGFIELLRMFGYIRTKFG